MYVVYVVYIIIKIGMAIDRRMYVLVHKQYVVYSLVNNITYIHHYDFVVYVCYLGVYLVYIYTTWSPKWYIYIYILNIIFNM